MHLCESWSLCLSAVFSELSGEVFVSYQVFLTDRGLALGQSLHKVLEANGRLLQLTVGYVVHSHLPLGRIWIAWSTRSPHATWQHLEVSCVLAFSDWDVQGFLCHSFDISSRVQLWVLSEFSIVFILEGVLDSLHLQLKHGCSCRFIGKTDVDSLLKSSSEGLIKFPWSVGGSHDKDTFLAVSATIHLDQEFSLDSSWWLVFSFCSLSAKGVDLINEDERWSLISCKLEQVHNQLFWLTLPLGDQVRRRNWEEGTIAFGGTSLGQETLTSSWWSVEQYTCPWLSGSLEELWELDWHDDSFFKTFLGSLESTDIVPFDVWLLSDNGIAECSL